MLPLRFSVGMRQRGLTLLELLVVVAILAAVASVAYAYQLRTQQRMAAELDQVQVAELVRALRRFHDDTGFFPRQGPFALSGDADGAVTAPADCTGACAADFAAGFASPANLQQLYEPPTGDPASTVPLAWLAASASENPPPSMTEAPRHWRGPYLRSAAAGALHVLVGSDLLADGSGQPDAGVTLYSVIGLADTRPVSSQGCGMTQPYCWFVPDADGNVSSRGFVQRAAPYLFILGDGGPVNPPRVVSLGADGRYGGVNPAQPCQPANDSDDLVVCL